jgi:hypothetical protein
MKSTAQPPTPFAVCLAGQLRTLVFPVVQRRLNATILEPLQADAFVVASLQWSRAANLAHPSGELVRPWYEVHEPPRVRHTDLERIRSALPAIRSAVVAPDHALLNATARWVTEHVPVEALMHQRSAGDTILDPRERCGGNTTITPAWQIELCHTRVIHAARLRLCLGLIEDSEASRRQPYKVVIRTRPDVWLGCVLTPRALRLATDSAAFQSDYFVALSRAAASISLREIELSPGVPMCVSWHRYQQNIESSHAFSAEAGGLETQGGMPSFTPLLSSFSGGAPFYGRCSYPSGVEQCNPCLLRKHGFVTLSLRFNVDVARQCATQLPGPKPGWNGIE